MKKYIKALLIAFLALPFISHAGSLDEIYKKYDSKMFTLQAPNEKHKIVVLFDLECPYCQKLMTETAPTLVKNGITISFYPYPKNGMDSQGANYLVSSWQWQNPFAKAFFPKENIPNKVVRKFTHEDLSEMYNYINSELGGVTGTPTTLLDNGKFIQGAYKPDELLKYYYN
ncbi:thioredoxin fold domain-containing protein [Vibrio gangliei]|uniref:thioredoxin fold domain-containing protein n=1 Tax=Vibrio gangliei TaxID=2077090 RepID=UPI000D0161C6|nr:thioredoxin fold domain-containing protein [Vibrio gangliei]